MIKFEITASFYKFHCSRFLWSNCTKHWCHWFKLYTSECITSIVLPKEKSQVSTRFKKTTRETVEKTVQKRSKNCVKLYHGFDRLSFVSFKYYLVWKIRTLLFESWTTSTLKLIAGRVMVWSKLNRQDRQGQMITLMMSSSL